jgi:hypothetical protein
MADISKNTILVLVVLTIAISLLGFWTVMSELSNLGNAQLTSEIPEPTPTGEGKVQISIVEPPHSTTTGQVTIDII